VSFDVAPEAYSRFMGRFSEPLAEEFLAFTGVPEAGRALDVGCGPGALTERLVERLGASSVAAVDPSASFVEAVTARCPGVDAHRVAAERLPFADGAFDAAYAQLVVHFMAHPVAGLREMERVTRRGGVVAACVWDHAGGSGPLSVFWQAAHDTDTEAPDEGGLPGTREGHLVELFVAAGIRKVRPGRLEVAVEFASFDDWWDPFTLGVGPAGAYVDSLPPARQDVLRDRCAELLAAPPIRLRAAAWVASGLS
jgi:SAM-dependent methyltransferase